MYTEEVEKEKTTSNKFKYSCKIQMCISQCDHCVWNCTLGCAFYLFISSKANCICLLICPKGVLTSLYVVAVCRDAISSYTLIRFCILYNLYLKTLIWKSCLAEYTTHTNYKQQIIANICARSILPYLQFEFTEKAL